MRSGSLKSHLLFVDDEQNVLDGMRRALRPYRDEWDFSFAGGVDEALERLQCTPIDTIVSDINMPGKDGLALLQILGDSEQTRDIPVIILTGNGQMNLKRRALDLGATDLLNKPIDTDDLVARLRSALRLKRYQDEIKEQNALLECKVQERTHELNASRVDMIWRLGMAAEFRSEETGSHVIRVGCYCRAITHALQLPSEFAELIFLTSPLHDIGKIGIPDYILQKPGKLSPAEREIMKQHCVIGHQILSNDSRIGHPGDVFESAKEVSSQSNPLLEMAATIALTHHESWNGNGYPNGLRGETIPLAARIVAIADVFDALSTARAYKPALPEQETLEIISQDVGKRFDPEIYQGFLRSLKTIRDIRHQFQGEEKREWREAA